MFFGNLLNKTIPHFLLLETSPNNLPTYKRFSQNWILTLISEENMLEEILHIRLQIEGLSGSFNERGEGLITFRKWYKCVVNLFGKRFAS